MQARPDERDRQSIRCDLESADEEVRRLAVERAAGLPPEEALPILVDRLGDASWRVRKAVVERLVAAPEREAIARCLVEALADGDNSGRRNAALEALIRCGASAVPRLIEASADEDADVRKQAVDALAGIGDRRAAPRLTELLRDGDPNVRAAAADAIGLLAGPELAGALVEAAHDDMERLVRLSALRALGRLEVSVPTDDLAALIHDPHLRSAAFEVLGNSEAPEAFDWLLKGLESNSRSAREAAIGALLRNVGRAPESELPDRFARIREAASACPELLGPVHERLTQAGLSLRLMLVQFLGLLARPESVRPILEAARDEALTEIACETLASFGAVAETELVEGWTSLDSELQLLATNVLGRTGGAGAEPCLLETLRHRDPLLRAAAARALGRRGCTDALEQLVDRLHAAAGEEGSEGAAEVAAIADAIVALASLPEAGADAAVRRLVSGLSGSREGYRAATARILGRLGRSDDEAVIGLLLSDPSPAVRRAAIEDLIELAEERVAEPLRLALADDAPDVRTAAAAALATRRDADASTHLTALAADPDPGVRAAAIRAAGRRLEGCVDPTERAASLKLFEQALSDEGSVAMALAEALSNAGGSDCAGLALKLFERSDPELIRVATACVGRHGDLPTLEQLLPLLAHGAWAVRAEAVRWLAERNVARALPAILRRLDLEQDPFVREAILAALRRLES